ncbi:MAG: phenylalanine--tRNA ligase subunit alpha [Clostridia bacterium]|nr:phenylalanine--tRNA ligase subunit alpha [Clostridia bacterium]MBR2496276.1 phenylalanine--tRNA ligase subunit alpha [Clostridia bacterium]
MKERIANLIAECKAQVESALDLRSVNELKVKYLGKNSPVTELMKGLKNCTPEERPVFGKIINDCRNEISAIIVAKESVLKEKEKNAKLEKEAIDITLPSKSEELGALHPLTIVKNEIIDAFTGLGFSITEGPEIDTDWNTFQALNIPEDHPARDMQDTFYIGEGVVLRPHTSPAQIRTMLKQKPPIKILCPGRVYRADDDATHSPMFHQIEGLVVDKGITLNDLKGILDEFVKTVFAEDCKTRFRPSYFPFTEPSVEVDVSCMKCGGKGCNICKGTGWIEILGSGVVNRNVFTNCDIDPDEYTGFAFGLGIERIAMIKYGIPDIRMLFENDVRFLKQFK